MQLGLKASTKHRPNSVRDHAKLVIGPAVITSLLQIAAHLIVYHALESLVR